VSETVIKLKVKNMIWVSLPTI